MNRLDYKYLKIWSALIITITIIYLLFLIIFESDVQPIIENLEILKFQHPRILQNFAPPLSQFSDCIAQYDVKNIL